MTFPDYMAGLDDGYGSAGGYGGVDDAGGCCGCIVSLILCAIYIGFASLFFGLIFSFIFH